MAQEAANLKKVDPLDLLRDYAMRKKTIVPEDDFICFGDQKFPSDTRTRFHSNKGESQTLQTLWFCLAQEKKSHADYLKQCQLFKYNFLTLLDRTELLRYLNGKIPTSNRIKAISSTSVPSSSTSSSTSSSLEEKEVSKERNLKRTGGEVGERLNKRAKIGAMGEGEGGEWGRTEDVEMKDEKIEEARRVFGEGLELIGTDTPRIAPDDSLHDLFRADYFITKQICEKERVKNTPETFLLHDKKDFSKLLAKLEDLKPQSNTRGSGKDGKGEPERPLRPIIIVPSVITSLITLYNCADFLEDDKWISPVEKKAAGIKKQKFITVEKVLHEGEDPVTFRVTDSPVQLTQKEWKDVAVVFALGADWQFKGWLYPDPAVLFSRCQGFFFTFTDVKIPPLIKQWNVKIISVDRRHRHLDRVAATTFWDLVRHRLRRRAH